MRKPPPVKTRAYVSAFTEIIRWSGSFVLVLSVHSALFALAVQPATPSPPAPSIEPPAAILLELSPLAPPAEPDTLPVPDLSEMIPEPEPPPPVEPLPPAIASVKIHQPAPTTSTRPQTQKKPPEKKPEKPAREAKAAPSASPDDAPAIAAPTLGMAIDRQSAALPTWKAQLLRHLEKHKRYPTDAQRNRTEGVAYVLFTMTRDGRVLNARIERGSGNPALDREGLELLTRAEPLPPLPQDQPGEALRLVVPVQFFMRR